MRIRERHIIPGTQLENGFLFTMGIGMNVKLMMIYVYNTVKCKILLMVTVFVRILQDRRRVDEFSICQTP